MRAAALCVMLLAGVAAVAGLCGCGRGQDHSAKPVPDRLFGLTPDRSPVAEGLARDEPFEWSLVDPAREAGGLAFSILPEPGIPGRFESAEGAALSVEVPLRELQGEAEADTGRHARRPARTVLPAVSAQPLGEGPAPEPRAGGRFGSRLAIAADAGGARFELLHDLPGRRVLLVGRSPGDGPDDGPAELELAFGEAREGVRFERDSWSVRELALGGLDSGRAGGLDVRALAGTAEIAGVLLLHPAGDAWVTAAGAEPAALLFAPEPEAAPLVADSRFDPGLRWIEVGQERRPAALLPAGAQLEFPLELDSARRLRLGLASVRAPDDAADLFGRLALGSSRAALAESEELSPAAFEVAWRPEGATARELSRLDSLPFAWTPLELELPAGPGTLILRATGPVGSAAAALSELRLAPAPDEPGDDARPNLLLYVVDTLRADALSCLGARRRTTPRIDALAADGFLFEEFLAVASWTRPTMATLLTGAHPQWHGLGNGLSLPQQLETLAEDFARADYRTLAAVSNANVGSRGLNFEQGFERFVTHDRFGDLLSGDPAAPPPESSSERLNRIASAWLDELQRADGRTEPFLIYLHSLDPHSPYLPPVGAARPFSAGYTGRLSDQRLSGPLLRRLHPSMGQADREFVRAVYDEEVLHQDAVFGALVDELQRRGRLDDTVIVLTSDHGEEFAEHGNWDHGYRMWEELLHVPLVVWLPEALRAKLDSQPARISAPISQAELRPGLLDLFGLTPGIALGPSALLPLIAGRPAAPRPYFGSDGQAWEGTHIGALRDSEVGDGEAGPLKLIWNEDPATGFHRERLFDLAEDPLEQLDLASSRPADVARLLAQRRTREAEILEWPIEGLLPASERGGAVQFDAATQAQLEQLGYY